MKSLWPDPLPPPLQRPPSLDRLLPPIIVPPQYLAPLPVFSWTGFNIGIDGGFGGGVINADTILFQPPIIIGGVTFSPGSVSTLHTSNRTEGVIVGGQVGYNYELPKNIVVGIESDAQWSDVKESETWQQFIYPNSVVQG